MCQCSQNALSANFKQNSKTRFPNQDKAPNENLISKQIFPWVRSEGKRNSTSQKMTPRASEGKRGRVDSAVRYKSQQQEGDFHDTERQHIQAGTEKPAQENSSDRDGFWAGLFLCSICRRFVAQKRTRLS